MAKYQRRSYTLDTPSLERLERLATLLERDQSAIVRDGLLHLELQQGYVRDLVRQAVLDLANTVEPDECYDPADDPRREPAVLALAELLGSVPAAEGVALALIEIWNKQQKGLDNAG